jgi:formate/nitrite transporter FocA (FNT family)
MYFVPMGMLLSGGASGDVNWSGFLLGNLLPVTLGNVAGGSVMVGLAYWFIYLRKR